MAVQTKKVAVLDIDATQSKKTIKELRAEMKGFKDEMANLEEGSEEFLNVAKQAGELRHQISEINQTVNALSGDFGDKMKNIGRSIAGVVGGMQAVKATLTLVGVESENVEKAIQKMQASMALVQGIQAIDDASKAFKNLITIVKNATASLSTMQKTMMGLAGVGIIGVITLIATNWDKIATALGIVNKRQQELNNINAATRTAIDGLKDSQKELNNEYERQITLLQAAGASQKEILELRKIQQQAIADSNNNLLTQTLNAYGYATLDQYNQTATLYKQITNQINDDVAKGQGRDIKRDVYLEQNKKAITNLNKSLKTLADVRADFNNFAEVEKNINDILKIVDDANFEVKVLDTQITKINNDKAKDKANQNKADADARNKALEDLKKQYLTEIELYQQKRNEELKIAEGDAELQIKINEKYDNLIAGVKKKQRETERNEEIAETENQNEIELTLLVNRLANGEISYKEYIEAKKKLDNEYLDNYISTLELQLQQENITADEILAIQKKINDAKIQKAANSQTDTPTSTGLTIGQQIASTLDIARESINELADDPAWGNILARIANIAEDWDKLVADMKEGGAEGASAILQIAGAGFGAISDLMEGLKNSQDESTKEGFENQKKLSIAETVFSMLSGIANAWSSSLKLAFPLNIIVGSVLSTFMGALGGVQINQIAKTQFDSANTSGASASSSSPNLGISSSVLSGLMTPTPAQSYITGGQVETDINPVVSVVEIEKARNKVNVTETESRY